MNILLILFLLFLVIVLLFSNLKYRNKFQNYYDRNNKGQQRLDNNINVIVNNYIAQLLKYIFERKSRNDNMPVKFNYFNNN
jgi:hypothetical protein